MSRIPASFVTRFRLVKQTLVVDLRRRRKVLSSAPRGGGFVRARYILNHQVPANPMSGSRDQSRCQWSDPARYLGVVAADLGADDCSVALMTAVPLKQLVVLREAADGLWVEGFFTVGVTNAVRAGEPVNPARSRRRNPGTINMILVTNAFLTAPAMVGLVQVATESKTAVLLSKRVPSWTGKPGATGTGTDAVIVASGAQGDGPVLKYSGTHTKLGELVGRLVGRGMQQGLAMSRRWSRRRTG